jgi:hypothetical protein
MGAAVAHKSPLASPAKGRSTLSRAFLHSKGGQSPDGLACGFGFRQA